MNKSYRIKLVVTLLAMMMIASSLFATGIKEANDQAVTVRVLSALDNTITARTLDGNDIVFMTNDATVSTYPVSALSTGDYLEVVMENGIATDIRYINPLVATGVLPYSISTAQATSLGSLEDRFSYTYGFMLIQSFASQGLYFDAGYYVKGAMDGYAASQSDTMSGYYTLEELYANVDTYQQEIWSAGLARTDYGTLYNSIDEVKDLPKPTDTDTAFSYTYGYLLALNMAGQGIKVNGDLYATGALDYACGNQLLMNEAEMQSAFTEYQQQLEQEYQAWLTEVSASNLKEAEAFLAQNKNNEGVITTDSGLQYQVLTPADGAMPTMDDTVEVNYQLQLMDGTVLESSYDSGETAHFPVNSLIPGFTEALLKMNTGSVIRTWIHPSLGYGETGTDKILPNALLIFDIELVGIDK